jgi:hypothetical protein
MDAEDPNKLCFAGYYCKEGSSIPNPIGDPDGVGDICQPGYYCEEGSFEMTPCPPGTYEFREGSSECQVCPAGWYCEEGATKPLECFNGYCPAGSSAPTLCPDGFYGSEDLRKLEALEDCPYCPNTMYCFDGLIQGECDAGYFCDFGALAWRDSSKECPSGHYCPSGAKLPIRCPETLYYSGTAATDVSFCKPCQEGYYCLDNDSVSRVCPKGHFCPEKTKEPVSCWPGTYNPLRKAGKPEDCWVCPAGTDCWAPGTDDAWRFLCPVGHYCP